MPTAYRRRQTLSDINDRQREVFDGVKRVQR